MLHRLTLRVIPSLALAVTEPAVRKRKRLVMLVPGLVAFALYRVVKLFHPVSDAVTLLVLSGLICAVTAMGAYRVSRQVPLATIWTEDGPRRVGWVAGWVGLIYGAQLTLLVLALCLVAGYDFRIHPAGPAMMALIIACTSVARDGFEIGHVRRLQRQGQPVLTFPDGTSLRALLCDQPGRLLRWFGLGVAVCSVGAWGATALGDAGRSEIGQLLAVTLLAGSLALVAYLDGQQPGQWVIQLQTVPKLELLRFWSWPGVWFAATYYLVLVAAVAFVLGFDHRPDGLLIVMAGMAGGVLTLYCYYLGVRRTVEDRVRKVLPDSLLRCPFVTGILSKGRAAADAGAGNVAVSPSDVVLSQAGRRE